jgi:hypothetical protein
MWYATSLTECNSGTKQWPFVANTMIELKNLTTKSDNTGTFVSWNIRRWMLSLSDIVVILIFVFSRSFNSERVVFGLCQNSIQWATCDDTFTVLYYIYCMCVSTHTFRDEGHLLYRYCYAHILLRHIILVSTSTFTVKLRAPRVNLHQC